MLIRNFWLAAWLAPPGVLPRRLAALHDELALLLLPPAPVGAALRARSEDQDE